MLMSTTESATTAGTSIRDALTWTAYPVAAGLASSTIDVQIGTIGSGDPVGVVTARVHGDEGPWGTLAVNRLLAATPADEVVGTLRVVPVAHPLATEAGARLALFDVQVDKLTMLVDELSIGGAEVLAVPVDLSDADSTPAASAVELEHCGTPRALIHNAALLRQVSMLDVTFDDWRRETTPSCRVRSSYRARCGQAWSPHAWAASRSCRRARRSPVS
jgi:hypothetical protein